MENQKVITNFGPQIQYHQSRATLFHESSEYSKKHKQIIDALKIEIKEYNDPVEIKEKYLKICKEHDVLPGKVQIKYTTIKQNT